MKSGKRIPYLKKMKNNHSVKTVLNQNKKNILTENQSVKHNLKNKTKEIG
ncbi:hypothetical protein SAMN06297358_0675 [Pedobacter xixiisoli]|uniref:Uncharacterized protein n=1 Tax=Pedobacter xixiisoli TaxID=1476464 RepID=A0A285ZS31_9SPHI|nr:hypothetical protein SAMN06297358_0675 [Pedobacter xixiisoli]